MSKYYNELYKQYIDCLGERKNLKEQDDEFTRWLSNLKELNEFYSSYIDYMGLDINNPETVELGKGKYDSISGEKTTVISPYVKGISKINYQLLLKGEPLIVDRNIEIQNYITHNPFTYTDVEIISSYRNFNGIYIGVYGNLQDKNKDSRLKMIKELNSKYDLNMSIEYETEDDKYLCVAHNGQKIKNYVK